MNNKFNNCSACAQKGYNTLNYYYDASCHPQFREGVGNPVSKLVEIRRPVLVETQTQSIENYIPCQSVPMNKFMSCKKSRVNCKQYVIP